MTQPVVVPDIGDFKEVEVIEVLVKPGDAVSKEQSLITLESDKATMEIPSPAAGVVKELRIKTGDKVSQGSPILDRKSTRLNSSHLGISYAVFCLKKKTRAMKWLVIHKTAVVRGTRLLMFTSACR